LGASDVRLTTTAVNETEPTLSPDGQRLAYVRDDGGTPRIYVSNLAVSNATVLTTSAGSTVEGSPSWRFSSDSLLMMSTELGNPTIFRASRTSGTVPASAAKPATSDSVYTEPSWSADGSRIAFTLASVGGASRVALLTRSTNVVTLLTPSSISAGQPAVLPDGRVVFTIFGAAGTSSLAWVDPARPLVVIDIPLLPGTNPQHPAIIWP
jgi:TolB protein